LSKQEILKTKSTIVYQNRWMTVREDEIVRADGSNGIYGIVEKSDFAVIVAISAGDVYLVEQYRYPVEGRFWEFPQGSWEEQTIDPLTLAKAELREETGLEAASMQHVGHLFLAYGFCTQGYDVFLASELIQLDAQREPEEQGLLVQSFPIAQVEAMIANGGIKDATTIAAWGLLRAKGLL
jgi:ADP-ribose pyrophosphatase